MRSPLKALVLVVLVALAAGLGFWAGRVTLAPQVQGPGEAPEIIVEVAEATVGRTLALNVTVKQEKRSLAVNKLTGVVTEINTEPEAAEGAVLYRVANVPVRAVVASTPFYRDLAEGVTGADVQALNTALTRLGHGRLEGATYSAATTRAVKAWQKALGVPQTGTIAQGELVAFAQLPSPVLLDTALLQQGAELSGGERIVFVPDGQPGFELIVSQEQARIIPDDATIDIAYEGSEWRAIIADSKQAEGGTRVFTLTAEDGGPVCGSDCGKLGGAVERNLPSTVLIVPPATGPAVPVAALQTDASGRASVRVVAADGTRGERPVVVKGSQDGVAIVEGVRVGERVVALAGGQQAPQPSATPSG